MSHEITVRKDGTEEFFAAGSTPVWHRLGQRVERALSSGAALKMTALDWKVDERPIYADIAGEMSEITTHKSIVRRDTQAVLGVVGRRYKPVQNEEAFEWLDDLVGSRLAVYETAGGIRQSAWSGHWCGCPENFASPTPTMWSSLSSSSPTATMDRLRFGR